MVFIIPHSERLVHPFDKQFVIPDILRLNIFNWVTKGISFVADVGTKSANLINTLSRELKYEEARFHAALPEHAQRVLKKIRTCFSSRNSWRIMDLVDMLSGVDMLWQL